MGINILAGRSVRILGGAIAAAALFVCGYAAGQNRFGMPHTIIHVVSIQWMPGVPDAEKQAALDGVKELAGKVPGIKNVWVKAERLQPRDFNAAFVIEFANRDAADRYAESAAHEEWEERYVPLRAASLSLQVTNP